MKILLVNPPFNISKDNYDSSISMGILCLASFLDSRGFSVKIIDGARQKNWQKNLEEEILSSDLIGFSVMTTQVSEALQLSKKARKINSRALIVWGGVHPTLFPESTAGHPFCDIAVIGEGEETLLEITESLKNRDLISVKQILGIAFKNKEGRVIVTEKRPLMKMSEIPLPNWELEPKEILENIDIIPTHTSRGCPHKCAFCVNAISNNIWRAREAREVLEDIRVIKSKKYFQGKPLRFWDENFFVNKKRAEEIIEGLIEKNLTVPWETTIRVNYLKKDFIDDRFLAKIRKSGCYLFSFGAESGSPRILRKLDKDITREEIINSARSCLRHGIIPQYSFMVGLPEETREDVKMTLSLIDELFKLSDRVQILGPQVFRPYPGGTLYEECLALGWKEPETLSQWAEMVENELNYLTPRNFPWISSPDFVESLEAYVRFGAHSIESALGSTVKAARAFKLAFILICKIRWKLKFFAFPWDFKLAKNFISRKKIYD